MAITAQAGTGASGVFTTSPGTTIPLPADVVAGDLLMLVVDGQGGPSITTNDPGYVKDLSLSSGSISVFFKVATASEVAPLVASAPSRDCAGVIVRFRGCETAAPVIDIQRQDSSTTTPSIDPVSTDAAKVAILYSDPNFGTGSAVTWATATPLASVLRTDTAYVGVGWKLEDTAGALAFTTTVTGTISTIVFSLRPTGVERPSIGTQTGNYETGGQAALAQALGWVYPSHGWYPPDQYFAGGRYLSPVADFVGVPTSGPYPLSVAFTDLSNVGAP